MEDNFKDESLKLFHIGQYGKQLGGQAYIKARTRREALLKFLTKFEDEIYFESIKCTFITKMDDVI